MAKLIKNWIIMTIVWFIMLAIWHNVVFGASYSVNLEGIVRKENGEPAPLALFVFLANIPTALGFAYFLPAVARNRRDYILKGMAMGMVTLGTFALLAHGLFGGWSAWLMNMDLGYGLAGGAIGGLVMSFLSKRGP
jgi:uncharacterized membrane protein